MSTCRIIFSGHEPVEVAAGALLTDAALRVGAQIAQPCGGQGRCGRCAVRVAEGSVRRRSTLRLTAEDVAAGYALACQTVVLGDAVVAVPEQDVLERVLTTDRLVADVTIPAGYDPAQEQSLQRVSLSLPPPTMDDQRDDWSRLQTTLRQATGIQSLQAGPAQLRRLGATLRAEDWRVTALISRDPEDDAGRLVDLYPGHAAAREPLLGIAVDIGTTTVSVWLVDLTSGAVLAQAVEYNRQIHCGEDVISRIIYAGKNDGQAELKALVLHSVNTLVGRVLQKAAADAYRPVREQIAKAVVVGNSIMIHLLLGVPAESIRLSPFVPAVNQFPVLTAADVGFDIHPRAPTICLPGVASYVGADITAGVLSSGLHDSPLVSLFMDIGTNGEIVLGCREWLVTCACSAGPAFEGAGVADGMRATRGAVEEVWIDGRTFEPTLRTIGDARPRGLCGSGLISLLAEMFLTGVVDKGGNINLQLPTPRVRRRGNGPEYVVAWASETAHGRDIAITHIDIDNLIRAKAAIYAGVAVLADSVGVPLAAVEQVLIGGSFGKYVNVEKGVQIGLLPDAPWEQFHFLGNTAVLGAYQALLSSAAQRRISDIAARMTYIELSADNSFYEAFTSALFLPHTDLGRFPSVASMLAPVT